MDEPCTSQELNAHCLFGGIPDNEWTAAVLAVGDTLRRAMFTDADIFAAAARGIPQQIIAHEIGPGTKGAARRGEHCGANAGIGFDGGGGCAQIRDQLEIQGIQSVRTVEGDEDNVIPALD